MKHFKLFFALFAMLALGVGNAWAETKIDEVSAIGFAGITEQGYTDAGTDYSAVANTTNNTSVTYAMQVFDGKTGAVRGNRTGNANFSCRNTTTCDGYYISKVVLTVTGGTLDGATDNRSVVYFGTSAYANPTTAPTGTSTKSAENATGTTLTWNNTNEEASYFILYDLKTSGTLTGGQVTITWTKKSGGVTPDPDPTTYTIKWHTAKGVTTDVTLNEGATITKPATDPTMTGYDFMGWTASCDVASDGSDFTAIEDFGTADSDKDFYAVFAVATTTGGGESTPTEVTDVLNRETTGVTGTSYTDWTGKTASSSAIYAGQSAGGNASIQLRSKNSNSGIITTASGGKVQKVVVEWNSETSIGNKLDIYGKNSAYSNATDLYNTTNQGTKLGSIVCGTSTELMIEGDYDYIGMRSNSGAIYMNTISITWSSSSSSAGTTTYSDYITTCASGIEYVELGDAFKWNATEAEVTIDATDNVFPTLTNTHTVPVTYSSSDDAIASIASDGTVTLNKEGIVTITAKYVGGTSAGTGKEYKAKTVDYSLKVNKAAPVASGTTYVKVTSTEGITNGEYLIVYETGKVAFNGALDALDVANNTLEVEITDGTIAGTNYIDDATFTIDATAKTIKSASGYYIGKTASGNGLNTDKTTTYTNTITIDADKNAVVVSSGGPTLRYNKASDQARFRYYGSGQQAIALYKKASEHTVTIATCTNGSVEASVANGAEVFSGTTITLSNTPATGYKLAAYDVYKTGEATTKVTETDGKFIMPEHDVTISATFELAKTLTGIEITTPATQTTFWQTETFNHDDLKVTAHFDGAADEDVTDKVTVTGSTETAGAAVEVTVSFTEGSTTKTITYTINVKAIPNTQETAYTVAEAYDIIDKLTTAEGVFIKGIVSQVDSYNETYKSITYWISDDGTTTKQLQVYSGKGLESADFVDINGVSIEDQVIVCGDLKKFNDTYEFDKNNYLAEHTKTTKADPELSYTTTEYNVNLGDEFTAPTLNNPHSLAVTYSSNNEDVATVAADGAVTIKAAGTVVITASFAGNEDYVAGEASYTINVTDPSVSSVTFDATIDKTADAETFSLTKDVITMTFTSGAMNNGENYRCYSGQTMTISYADGNITKIVLECTTNNDAKYGPGCFETETASYSYSGKVGTWTGEANSVTFNANDQVRMTTVTVYYKQDTRTPAGIAWNPATVSLTVGDAFTAPTLSNPNDLTGITFTSDNEDLATVNAGVISLVSGKTGTATITATYAGNETYKPAEVTCVITVNPKTETVVILAQYNGQWYALKNVEETAGKVLAALPVNYVGGKLYNVEEADKATIEWQRAAVTDGIIFKNGENYISGIAGDTDLKLSTTECVWTLDGSTYKIGNRTFIYRAQANGFKNYNATTTPGTDDYSNLPVVTAPVYGTGTITPMENLTPQMYGTICLENNVVGYEGITFYKVAGKEGYKVIFDEVTELVAGMPYIYIADSETATIVKGDKTAATPGKHNSLQGTFIQIDPAVDNILVGNYMLVNNVIKKCGKNCGLKANRAYFVATELENNLGAAPQPMPGRRRVTMGVTGENEATGVDNITENGVIAPKKLIENGQLIIIRDGVKYNVQGQKL